MSNQFNIIVIGAGINGAGIARDAAMRGLKVLLLDKGDIGGGTSSWSTRLIHGGLRYLEHGEFRLVRESLRERACLLNIAPHLVRPLPLLVPVYKNARRGLWTIRAGMVAYDALSFPGTLPRHRMLSRAETLRQAPALKSDGLLGAAVYFDAQVEFAERLVVENVLSAIAHGATVLTYARVEKLIVEDGELRGVEYTIDVQSPTSKVQSQLLTGTADVSPASRRISSTEKHGSASAHLVINAAGPWIDQVLGSGGKTSSPRLIGGTKGSHIIVAPFSDAPDTAIYVEAETGGRPFFIIPWNGKYLIGTTDIRYQGDLDHVRIDSDEIDYLLRETNRVFPGAKLTREQILYAYSGVRPLPFTGDKDEQSITRRHFIREHHELRGLFSIVGGKLTTYRSLAEQAVNLVLKKLPPRWDRGRAGSPAGQPGSGARPARSFICTTAHDPLPGASTDNFDSFCKDFKARSHLPETTNDHLLRTYGTRASLILNLLEEDQSLAEVFDAETGAIAAEVVLAFKQELATTLADCLLRRTMVGLNSTRGLTAVDAAGAIALKHLGWSADRVRSEVSAYREEVSRSFVR